MLLVDTVLVVALIPTGSQLSDSAQPAVPSSQERVSYWLATVPLPSGSIVQVVAFATHGTVVSAGPPVRTVKSGDPRTTVFNSRAGGT